MVCCCHFCNEEGSVFNQCCSLLSLSVFYHWLSPKGWRQDSTASNNWKVKLCVLLLMLTGFLDSRCLQLRQLIITTTKDFVYSTCVPWSQETSSWQQPMKWSLWFAMCSPDRGLVGTGREGQRGRDLEPGARKTSFNSLLWEQWSRQNLWFLQPELLLQKGSSSP